MTNEQIQEILSELQHQNGDLLNLYWGLQLSFYQHLQHLNKDIYDMCNIIQNPMDKDDGENFLNLKKTTYEVRNKTIDNQISTAQKHIDERVELMNQNLEKIKKMFSYEHRSRHNHQDQQDILENP